MNPVFLSLPLHEKKGKDIEALQNFFCAVIARARAALQRGEALPPSFIALFGAIGLEKNENAASFMEKLEKNKEINSAFTQSQHQVRECLATYAGPLSDRQMALLNESLLMAFPCFFSIRLEELLETGKVFENQ